MTNRLENIQCPHCRNTSRFRIVALVTANVSNDGAEFHGDAEWSDNSRITCAECGRGHGRSVQDTPPAASRL